MMRLVFYVYREFKFIVTNINITWILGHPTEAWNTIYIFLFMAAYIIIFIIFSPYLEAGVNLASYFVSDYFIWISF